MSTLAILITIASYFTVLFIFSYFTGRKADNEGFFSGNRKSPWYLVAFGTIGAAISGVTFVSVPGMVAVSGFSYLQMVLGFAVGQLIIAFILIPLYYKMNLVSIYEYLENRFGVSSYKTGAWFFFISKMAGAFVRLFVFGIFTKWKIRDRWVPLIAIISPAIYLILDINSQVWLNGYVFSHERLIFNALFTFIGLSLLIRRKKIRAIC